MVRKHFTTLEILDDDAWEQLKREARENDETVAERLFRIIAHYREFEEQEEGAPKIDEALRSIGATLRKHD